MAAPRRPPNNQRRPPNMPDQQELLRADLHRYVDACCDNWELIARQANEMGAGYPPSTLGDGGGGTSTLVEAQALTKAGPGEKADEWLSKWAEARGQLVNAYNDLQPLLPMSEAQKAKAQRRENSVELCAECNLPAPKVHRIDGKPYHADSCYHRVWRAQRREAG